MSQSIPYEVILLLVRVAFLFLLYFFVFQVIRILSLDLRSLGGRQSAVAAGAAGQARLMILEPGGTGIKPGTQLQLRTVTSIGRRPSNVVILNDEFVSGEHALIVWRDGRWWLSDVASTNGTYLNGSEVDEPTPVSSGDTITVGHLTLRLMA